MKKLLLITVTVIALFIFTACGEKQPVQIVLSDDVITVDGKEISTQPGDVYMANDIVFYLEGQGPSYGEGDKDEEHSQAEADRHKVIHITRPGDYIISGSLSAGQIAVDLGNKADKNIEKKVNITLDNADITCTVAPAVICYNAYECGDDDPDSAKKDVDTSAAGFNITLAEGSVNNISGSHVAKIFDEKGKKLHKYDAAIESLVSLNIDGNGELNLTSDNEGIETKLHMTINGGNLNINSQDDSLNAGEDGVSVITINNGKILCNANNGKEGDGIDSNGWLVINGGMVSAFSSERSMDSGLDSDNGVYINGGTVFATGSMYDEISADSRQNVFVVNTAGQISKEEYTALKSSAGDIVAAFNSVADYSVMVYSSPLLTEDDYTLYKTDNITGDSVNGVYTNITETENPVQLYHSGKSRNNPGVPGGERPGNMPSEFNKGEKPDFGGELPADFDSENFPRPPENPQGNFNMQPPAGFGGEGRFEYGLTISARDLQPVFTVTDGVNIFRNVQQMPQ